jgi:hypothetical protein
VNAGRVVGGGVAFDKEKARVVSGEVGIEKSIDGIKRGGLVTKDGAGVFEFQEGDDGEEREEGEEEDNGRNKGGVRRKFEEASCLIEILRRLGKSRFMVSTK